ncbi:PIN domain-containing protein [Mesorhizobium sp. SB112]|uniref:PIN domain-containing protein n=1 Tax=Mesorhizobium sp. SB112 TaxID=3151853 RepID=UPI003265F307
MSAALLDTNILIYAFSTDPRNAVAESLLASGCVVSIQGLNEFANVAHRKLNFSWEEVRTAIAAIRTVCPSILPLDADTQMDALSIAEKYRLSYFDSLMLAAGLRGNCEILWSEDMHDGLVIEDKLRIANPFKAG